MLAGAWIGGTPPPSSDTERVESEPRRPPSRSLQMVDLELQYWKKKLSAAGTAWFMAVQRGPRAFVRFVKSALHRRHLVFGDDPMRNKGVSSSDEMQRRVVLLRALRSCLAVALAKACSAAEVLQLRGATAETPPAVGPAALSLEGSRLMSIGRVSPTTALGNTSRGGSAAEDPRVGPPDDDTDGNGENMVKVEDAHLDVGATMVARGLQAAEECAKRVGSIVGELKRELDRLAENAGGDGAEEGTDQVNQAIMCLSSVQVTRGQVQVEDGHSSPGAARRRVKTVFKTALGVASLSTATTRMEKARTAVADVLEMVGITFRGHPGRSPGEGIQAMARALARRRRDPQRLARLPLWVRRPSALQEHWVRWTLVGVAAAMGGECTPQP